MELAARPGLKLVDEDFDGTAVVCRHENLTTDGWSILILRVQELELGLDNEARVGSKDGRRHHCIVGCRRRHRRSVREKATAKTKDASTS